MNSERVPVYHVHPENDTRKHKLGPTPKCWCKPTLTHYGDAGVRAVHHSEDGREFVEKQLGQLLDDDKKWGITEV